MGRPPKKKGYFASVGFTPPQRIKFTDADFANMEQAGDCTLGPDLREEVSQAVYKYMCNEERNRNYKSVDDGCKRIQETLAAIEVLRRFTEVSPVHNPLFLAHDYDQPRSLALTFLGNISDPEENRSQEGQQYLMQNDLFGDIWCFDNNKESGWTLKNIREMDKKLALLSYGLIEAEQFLRKRERKTNIRPPEASKAGRPKHVNAGTLRSKLKAIHKRAGGYQDKIPEHLPAFVACVFGYIPDDYKPSISTTSHAIKRSKAS
jgi:hypothetical protein